MAQMIQLVPAHGLAEVVISLDGGPAAILVTLTLQHADAVAEDVTVETTLDAEAIVRMRARLQQDVEFKVARPPRSSDFVIQIGIYRLEITSNDTGFTYVLSEGPFILGSAKVANAEDRAMREELGLAEGLVLMPAAERCRRPEASEEEEAMAAEAAGR